MGQIRCTQFFKDNEFGWSETVWSAADTPDLAMFRFLKLCYLRYRLLGTGPTSPYLRCSDDLVLRDSAIAQVNFKERNFAISKLDPMFGGTIAMVKGPALATPSDRPYSAILLRMAAGTRNRRLCYMRGCPDEIIIDPPGPLQPPIWQTAFDAYVDELKSGFWYFLRVNRDPLVAPIRNVTGMAGALPDIVITAPAHGFVTGDSIHADRFKGLLMPRGDYTVVRLTDDTLKLKEYTKNGYEYLSGGKLQKNIRSLGQITECVIRGETHHDTGLPFDRPRGRRKKKSPA